MKLRLILALSTMLALGACESSSEKAERFYQSGLALMEQGDLDRAIVELRNVFTYDGAHYEARKTLAEILMEKGDPRGAYSQYLRLAEQYPDNAEVRRALAQIAIEQVQWDEAERHGRMAVELDPDNPGNDDILLPLDYRQASLDDDDAARQQVLERARAKIGDDPDNVMARRIMVAEALEQGNPATAMADLDTLIKVDPDNLEYAMLKMGILADQDDKTEANEYLDQLVKQFPDNRDVQMTAVGWMIQNGNIDKAEARLREIAGPEDGETEGHLTLIKFMELHHGTDAALAEARRLAEANSANTENETLYRSLEAFYLYNSGQREEAIAILEAALAKEQPAEGEEAAAPTEQTNRIRSMLAGMRLRDGDRATAETLVQQVLTDDATNVYALRLKAQMELDDDKSTDAINTLRQALNQNPRDTETLLLLADAYGRAGNRELMGETLASAVDISNRGVDESLRYADFLMVQNRSAARTVVTDALQVYPQNIPLLLRQGQMALEDETYPQAEQAITALESIQDSPEAASAAKTLRGAMMLRQGRMDEGLAMLEERAEADGNAAAILSVIRAQVVAGRREEARNYLDSLLADKPDDLSLRMIDAGLALTENDPQRSEQILRDIISDDPQAVQAHELLYRQLTAAGRRDDALAALDAGLQANPDARSLLLSRAAMLESTGDIEGTIDIYDRLYKANTSDVIVANNLASMLATWRDDPETLARAAAVAQRLKGTQVPAFQDTYGWIVYRNGNTEEALTYLEPAAAALTGDPLVQYHLGVVQAKLGRKDQARESLTSAIELGAGRDLPQLADAQAVLDGLDSDGAAPAEGGEGTETPATAPAETATEPDPTTGAPEEPAAEGESAAPAPAN